MSCRLGEWDMRVEELEDAAAAAAATEEGTKEGDAESCGSESRRVRRSAEDVKEDERAEGSGLGMLVALAAVDDEEDDELMEKD